MQIQRIEARCNACLLCVTDCISGAWREVNGRPEMAAPQFCNQCGHCVAVCPSQAIVHEAVEMRQVEECRKELLRPDAYREIVRTRRSIRNYRRKDVPVEVIEEILRLAGYSPTASNLQNVGYIVITDKSVLGAVSAAVFGIGRKIYEKTRKGPGKIFYLFLKAVSRGDDLERYIEPMGYYIGETEKGRDFILHHAPALILVHGPQKGSFNSENCNIAAANIMNYAHALGLGTCYIGFLCVALKISRFLRKHVQLPKGRRVYACMVMGYPAFGHSFTTSRRKRPTQWITG